MKINKFIFLICIAIFWQEKIRTVTINSIPCHQLIIPKNATVTGITFNNMGVTVTLNGLEQFFTENNDDIVIQGHYEPHYNHANVIDSFKYQATLIGAKTSPMQTDVSGTKTLHTGFAGLAQEEDVSDMIVTLLDQKINPNNYNHCVPAQKSIQVKESWYKYVNTSRTKSGAMPTMDAFSLTTTASSLLLGIPIPDTAVNNAPSTITIGPLKTISIQQIEQIAKSEEKYLGKQWNSFTSALKTVYGSGWGSYLDHLFGDASFGKQSVIYHYPILISRAT